MAAEAIARPELAPGDRVKFADKRNLWDVAATTEHYTAFTAQEPFEPTGTLMYTVIDWDKGIRGPCNLVGQGWGDGSYSPEQCAEMLEEFENTHREDPAMVAARDRGETRWTPSWRELEVSHRNNVPVSIERVDRQAAA